MKQSPERTTESTDHQSAFELYASLGERRTYRQVASQAGVSERTVRHWARQEDWRRRLAEREAHSARQMADRALTSTQEDIDQQRKIIHLAIVKLARAIAEGQIKYQIGDLDRLVRLRAFLDGGPKGLDPDNKDDVLRFLKSVPSSILEEIAGDHPPWPRPDTVIILPDNHRDPQLWMRENSHATTE